MKPDDGDSESSRASSAFGWMCRPLRYVAIREWKVSQLGTQPMRPEKGERGMTSYVIIARLERA